MRFSLDLVLFIVGYVDTDDTGYIGCGGGGGVVLGMGNYIWL